MRGNPQLSTIPVIVLTGAQNEEQMRECMDIGSNMYLMKPISIADVMNVVTGVQRYWRKADELGHAAA